MQNLTQNDIVVDVPDLAPSSKKAVIRVLHVDDDLSMLEISMAILIDLGAFEIDHACCVDEAFKKLATESYDVVISDYEMPNRNGLQFLKELREQNNEIPFVLFTGKGREEVAIKALNLGADGYYNKQGSSETVYGELTHGIQQIVKRKKAEVKLEKSEYLTQKILHTTPNLIYIYDLIEHRNVYANREVLAFLGYTPEQIEAMGPELFANVLHPDDAEVVEKHHARFANAPDNTVFEVEYRIRHLNGAWRWLRSRDILFSRTKDGIGRQILGSSEDITERKEVKKALEKGNAWLNEAQSMANLGSWEWDIKTNQENWSDELYRIYGFEPQTFQPTYDSFLKALHPKDRSRVADSAKQALKGIKPYDIECRITRPNGETRYLHCKSEVFRNSQGEPVRMVGTDLDITERKEAELELADSEAKYRALVENADDAIVLTDLTGKHVYRNPAYFKNLGFKKDEVGVDGLSRVHPDDLLIIKAKMVELFKTGSLTTEYRVKHRDGSWVNRLAKSTLIYNQQHEPYLILSMVRDITELKKAEKELHVSLERERFLADLIRNASIAIAVASPNGRVMMGNEAFQELTGYNEDELKEITWNAVLTPPEWRKFETERLVEINQSKKSGVYRKEYIRKDGSRVPIEIVVHPFFDDKGFVSHYFGFITDITESRKAEAELKQRNEALERVAESIGSGLALIGKDYSVIWANKHLMDLGVTPNKKCYQTFNNLDTVCPDCGAKKVFEQNTPLDVHEYKTVDSKGETVWIELRATPLKDKNGNVTAALELAVPITERKKVEEALSKSEERYRSLADSLPEIVFEIDLNGKLTYANESAFQTTGYTKEDFVKGVCVFDLVEQKDKERAEEHFRKTLANEPSTENEYTFVRKDGSKFQNIIVSKPIVVEDRTVGLRGLVIDITERKKTEDALKESEKRSRAIVANAPIGIATSGPDIHFSSANEAFCKILGYTEDELRCLTFKDLTYPADLKESRTKMGELERGCISSFTLEKRYVRKDGTVINGKIMISAVRNQNGEPRLFVAELEDITERKKAEERQKALERKIKEYSEHLKYLVELKTVQLKDANERLVKSERLAAIGELAGMVGHDLRNPLTGIKNAAYYLKKKGTAISESQAKEMLDVIDDAIDHSNKIINDLLDYSREMHLELIKYQASTLVEDATRMVNVPSHVEIVNKVPEEAWIWVDSDKMVRVFTNLIKNAIEAMPEGGKVEISSCQTNESVEIAFADTGTGITDETMAKLFLPLFTTKAQGMGFGLAICKRIVEAHGGTVTVETAVNKGTTFKISLPINPKEPTSQ